MTPSWVITTRVGVLSQWQFICFCENIISILVESKTKHGTEQKRNGRENLPVLPSITQYCYIWYWILYEFEYCMYFLWFFLWFLMMVLSILKLCSRTKDYGEMGRRLKKVWNSFPVHTFSLENKCLRRDTSKDYKAMLETATTKKVNQRGLFTVLPNSIMKMH